MLLNNDHIEYINRDLQYRGIVLEGFHEEVLDHICSAVEQQMEQGKRFIDAYHHVLQTFGETSGLRRTQKEVIQSENKNTGVMLRNYFRIALRNLSKQRFYSFINASGLALGIAACILIMLYVTHELGYDRYHEKAARIYRVNGEIKFADNHFRLAVAPAPLGPVLLEEYPEIESVVRFRDHGSYLVRAEKGVESAREFAIIFADSTVFQIFSIPVIQGNAHKALVEPNTIAISQSAADKYFHGATALGQTLMLDNKLACKVTAVFEDMPSQGHFKFEFIISMAGFDEAKSTNFLSNNFNTYVLLREGTDPKQLERKLPDVVRKYIGPQAAMIVGGEFDLDAFIAAGNKLEYTLMPITDIHLHSDLTGELSANNDITYVYLFSAIALFILFIACINFMNLSTARSANRAKEVGIRKVMGSLRSHLVRQFLLESILLSLCSFVLAMGIAHVALPFFNYLSGLQLSLPLTNPGFYVWTILGALIIGILAGLYPSIFLSAFQPAKVLKGQLALGTRSKVVRGSLVVFQFAISIFLIIGTVTIHEQLAFIQNKKIGFDKEQVIMVSDAYLLGSNTESFKNEVLKNSAMVTGTLSSYVPVGIGSRNNNTFWPDNTPPTAENMVGLETWVVDHDYVSTMKMKIHKGRDFSRDFPSDSMAVILNQTALRYFNFTEDNAIGRKISTYGESNADGTPNTNSTVSYNVIGIVEDFHFQSLTHNIGPLALFLGKSYGHASFRFEAANTADVIESIESTWKELAKGQPFEYHFLDESFARMYASEARLGNIFAVFAGLAIAIACLGVFALTAFTAEQRTREIGIRKVLGASVQSIVVLLSREFGKLIAIAFVLAAPLTWYAVRWWLEHYQYKVEIGFLVYVIAGLFAFAIALLTMSYQSIKAATANPTHSLRSE